MKITDLSLLEHVLASVISINIMMKQDLEVFQELISSYCIFFSKPFYHMESALRKRYTPQPISFPNSFTKSGKIWPFTDMISDFSSSLQSALWIEHRSHPIYIYISDTLWEIMGRNRTHLNNQWLFLVTQKMISLIQSFSWKIFF